VAVITPEEIAEQMMAGMGILRDTPRKYLPIIYSISFMVVGAIVTSIVDSRRRELRMLHVIGSSRIQVRVLFAVECMIAAVTAGLVGYLPLWLLGRFVLGTTQISPLPLLITLSGASLIVSIRSAFLLNEDPSEGVSM
jgi:ABC-type antimicrobial peptide transport system permease subunit